MSPHPTPPPHEEWFQRSRPPPSSRDHARHKAVPTPQGNDRASRLKDSCIRYRRAPVGSRSPSARDQDRSRLYGRRTARFPYLRALISTPCSACTARFAQRTRGAPRLESVWRPAWRDWTNRHRRKIDAVRRRPRARRRYHRRPQRCIRTIRPPSSAARSMIDPANPLRRAHALGLTLPIG